jgi:hypothetical protein
MAKKNVHIVKITGSTLPPKTLEVYLEKLCWLRTARKIGDIETVNNTQLGRLNNQSLLIQYTKINEG